MSKSPFGSWSLEELRDAYYYYLNHETSKRRLAREFSKSITSSEKVLRSMREKCLIADDDKVTYNGQDYYFDELTFGVIKSGKANQGDTSEEYKMPCYVVLDDPKRYLFMLQHHKPFAVPWETIQAIFDAYSNLGSNGRHTIHQLAVDQAWAPRTTGLILKALGLTHASLPFSDEMLGIADEEQLATDMLRAKEGRVLAQYNIENWRKTQRDAEAWIKFKAFEINPLAEVIRECLPNYKVDRLSIPEPREKFAVVVMPADLHYGKWAWEDECGNSYTRQEAREFLLDTTQDLFSDILCKGQPDEIILCTGGDWFHVDTWHGTTTKGTQQDTDGSLQRIVHEGCDLACTYIDLLRQIAPVKVIVIPGNHDRTSTYALEQRLLGQYANVEDVDYELCARSRQHYVYGNKLMLFAHGSDENRKELPAIVAGELRHLMSSTKQTLIFTADKHHHDIFTERDTILIQVPSMSGPDRWHHDKGYGSISAGSAYLIPAERRKLSIEYTESRQEVPAGD